MRFVALLASVLVLVGASWEMRWPCRELPEAGSDRVVAFGGKSFSFDRLMLWDSLRFMSAELIRNRFSYLLECLRGDVQTKAELKLPLLNSANEEQVKSNASLASTAPAASVASPSSCCGRSSSSAHTRADSSYTMPCT